MTSTLSARGQSQVKCGLIVRIGSSPRVSPEGLPRRTSITTATTSISTANDASRTSGSTSTDQVAPSAAPTVPTSAKANPRPTRTLPCRWAATAPAAEEMPTISSDAVVAATGVWSIR